MKNLLTNKTSKFLYIILFFVCIFRFPSILFLFLGVAVIAIMFAAANKDLKKQKTNQEKNKIKINNPEADKLLDDLDSADPEKIGNLPQRVDQLLKNMKTPNTFYEVIGDLAMDTLPYYSEILNQNKKTKKSDRHIQRFENSKKICDDFFNGNETMKCWVIYRTLEKQGLTEKEFKKSFPDLTTLLRKIRTKNWKDVAFYYLCSELVEADYGKDRLTKELLSKMQKLMDPKKLNEHIKNLSKEQKDDYKLLLKIDLLNDKKRDQEIFEKFNSK